MGYNCLQVENGGPHIFLVITDVGAAKSQTWKKKKRKIQNNSSWSYVCITLIHSASYPVNPTSSAVAGKRAVLGISVSSWGTSSGGTFSCPKLFPDVTMHLQPLLQAAAEVQAPNKSTWAGWRSSVTFFPLALSGIVFGPRQMCCEKPLTRRENTGSSCSKGKFASFLKHEFSASVYDHFRCTEHKEDGWMPEAFIPSEGERVPRKQYIRFGWLFCFAGLDFFQMRNTLVSSVQFKVLFSVW